MNAEKESCYQATKTCKVCGTSFLINLSKNEAVFAENRNPKIKHAKCPQCGSVEYRMLSYPCFKLDEESMEIWAKDQGLCFWEQDEDLMLAGEDIELITKFIDIKDVLLYKRNVLVSSLCVTIYDKDKDWKKAIEILNERKQFLEDAKSYVSEYIRKKVYPKFGLKWKD